MVCGGLKSRCNNITIQLETPCKIQNGGHMQLDHRSATLVQFRFGPGCYHIGRISVCEDAQILHLAWKVIKFSMYRTRNHRVCSWCFCFTMSSWEAKEVLHGLSQLIALHGFNTDATNMAGVERLVVTSVQDSWLEGKRCSISSSDLEQPDLIDPQTVFVAKGFNRSVCALLVLLAAYENEELLKAWKLQSFTSDFQPCVLELSNTHKS